MKNLDCHRARLNNAQAEGSFLASRFSALPERGDWSTPPLQIRGASVVLTLGPAQMLNEQRHLERHLLGYGNVSL
jgi:hypothetical protein